MLVPRQFLQERSERHPAPAFEAFTGNCFEQADRLLQQVRLRAMPTVFISTRARTLGHGGILGVPNVRCTVPAEFSIATLAGLGKVRERNDTYGSSSQICLSSTMSS